MNYATARGTEREGECPAVINFAAAAAKKTAQLAIAAVASNCPSASIILGGVVPSDLLAEEDHIGLAFKKRSKDNESAPLARGPQPDRPTTVGIPDLIIHTTAAVNAVVNTSHERDPSILALLLHAVHPPSPRN